MWILDLGEQEYSIDYHRIAIEAANCYRAIDGLVWEFEAISPENPRGIKVFERFLYLHAEFYGHIIMLTSEDTWIIDEDFKKEVQDEAQGLKTVIEYLKKEKWFLEALTGKVVWRSNQMADIFAQCVADILEWYEVDSKTNEIFFVND